jgi:hypothetical protein
VRQYCRACGISYPGQPFGNIEHAECDVCGMGTISLDGEPDRDWAVSVEYAKAFESSPEQRKLILNRRRRFVALGASGLFLDLLVESAISPHDFSELRSRGATADQAARILL